MKKAFFVAFLGLMVTLCGNCSAQSSGWDAPDIKNPSAPATNSGGEFTSLTIAGGPILSKHFQSGDNNFNQHHAIGIVKVGTKDYGNWGVYFLNPNSVRKTSIGGGYITDPYVIPMGTMQMELTGGIGLVSGYQNYPVPLLSGEARLAVYQSGPWNAGVEMAAMPYIAEDTTTHKNKFGIVGTTPFLSVRYNFN